MKFLVDAQLPRFLCRLLRNAGHDALHTLDLPRGNRTEDSEIEELAEREGRAVVTKDNDFVDSFLLRKRPQRLLLISTGNLSNAQLELLFVPQIPTIADLFSAHHFIELTRSSIILHS